MKLSQLKPNAKNPRKISNDQLARLKESIKQDPEFMVLRPIVYDSSDKNKILGGNMRFKACKELGMSEIPDEWAKDGADLTDDKKRRFILVDNAPEGMSGEWETSILLDEWELPELEDLGFDADFLDVDNIEIVDEEEINHSENFIIKCSNSSEVAVIQAFFKVKSSKITFDKIVFFINENSNS